MLELFSEALEYSADDQTTHFPGFPANTTPPNNTTNQHTPGTSTTNPSSANTTPSVSPPPPLHPPNTNMAALPLEVGLIRSPFDGESTDVRDFLRECEENVKGRNILPSSDQFGEACLTVAKCRLNYKSRAVTSALHAFNAQARVFQTWPEFRETFIASFGKPAVTDTVRLFETFERRPPSFDEEDLRTFINELTADICLWGQECAEATFSAAMTSQATSKSCQIYLIKSILVGGVPANKREKVSSKIKNSTIHTLAHDFATAVKADNITVAVNAAWQGNNSSQGVKQINTQSGTSNEGRTWHRNVGNPSNPTRYRHNGNYAGQGKQPQHIWVPATNQCYSCLRMGHRSRECTLSPMCPYHGDRLVIGHSWLNCQRFEHKARQTLEKLKQIKQTRGKNTATNTVNNKGVAVFHSQPLLGNPSAAISDYNTMADLEDDMES